MGRKKAVDLTGMVFGRLTVIRWSGRDNNGYYLWECNCSCGATGIIVKGINLSKGLTRSCQCLRNEVSGNRFKEMHKKKSFCKRSQKK